MDLVFIVESLLKYLWVRLLCLRKTGGYKRSDVGVINLRDISVSMHDVSVLALKANLAFTLACESVNNIDVADLVYPVQKEGYIDILKFLINLYLVAFQIMKMFLADYIPQLRQRLIHAWNISHV